MKDTWQDLRYGLHLLGRNPGFTAVAVLTLALGIGATTAFFSVMNAILLRPLPFEEPDRLVRIFETEPEILEAPVTGPDFLDWRAQATVFEELAAYAASRDYIGFNLTGAGEPERVQGAYVSPSFFSLLRINPLLGRAFLPEEEQPAAPRVVILSHRLWQRHFDADSNLIGESVTLDGESFTVIGVLPPRSPFGFEYVDVWVPLTLDALNMYGRREHWLQVLARLKPGVTLTQAQVELGTIARRLQAKYPETNTSIGVKVMPLRELVVRGARPALLMLFGAVGLVLLIACANVASLLLVRSVARTQEIAIRMALGASRSRVIRQLLMESALLGILGGLLGLLVALWGQDLFMAFSPGLLPRMKEVGVDGRVLGFSLMISILAGVLFGLAPALLVSKPHLTQSLKGETRSSTAGSRSHRLCGLLVISEVALALVLLIGAGLLIRSLQNLLSVNLGFEPEHVLTMRLELPDAKYSKDEQVVAFFQRVLERIQSLPEIQFLRPLPFKEPDRIAFLWAIDSQRGRDRAEVSYPDFVGWRSQNQTFEDLTAFAPATFNLTDLWEPMRVNAMWVSASLFSLWGIEPILGRTFRAEEDRPGARRVVVVCHPFGVRHLGSRPDVIGQTLMLDGEPYTVIGVLPPSAEE